MIVEFPTAEELMEVYFFLNFTFPRDGKWDGEDMFYGARAREDFF